MTTYQQPQSVLLFRKKIKTFREKYIIGSGIDLNQSASSLTHLKEKILFKIISR